MEDLVKNTEFNEHELKQWYKGFLKDCPTGRLNLEEFQQLYVKVRLSCLTLSGWITQRSLLFGQIGLKISKAEDVKHVQLLNSGLMRCKMARKQAQYERLQMLVSQQLRLGGGL